MNDNMTRKNKARLAQRIRSSGRSSAAELLSHFPNGKILPGYLNPVSMNLLSINEKLFVHRVQPASDIVFDKATLNYIEQ
jgi:hypothetical protein